MLTSEKIKLVDELKKNVDAAIAIFADYSGLTVKEFLQLRRKLRGKKSHCRVVKNTLLERLYADLNLPLKPFFSGPTVVVWGFDDPLNCLKAISDFNKEFKKFQVKGGIFGKQLLLSEDVKRLSSLPSREVLLAQTVGAMKAPISGFVFVLSGLLSKFVRTIEEIKKLKELKR